MAEENPKDLSKDYKEKGFQQMTLKEYNAQRLKKEKKQKKEMPAAIKYILMTPFILIFCFGLFFIPFMIYQFFVGLSQEKKPEEKRQIQPPLQHYALRDQGIIAG